MLFRVRFIRLLSWILLAGVGWQMRPFQARAIQFVPPQTDETSDPSDRPRGGGSRPICNPPDALTCAETVMVALVPQSNSIGLTLSATPKLWFFSPYKSDEPIQASFNLVNSQDQIVWQESEIQLASEPGIFSYQIPAQANLQRDQTYHWYLAVHLNPDQPASDVQLAARLRYKNAPQITSGNPIEQIQELANQGIWYDLVTTLAQLQQSERSLWETFLREHGFPDLVHYPVHGSYFREYGVDRGHHMSFSN